MGVIGQRASLSSVFKLLYNLGLMPPNLNNLNIDLFRMVFDVKLVNWLILGVICDYFF